MIFFQRSCKRFPILAFAVSAVLASAGSAAAQQRTAVVPVDSLARVRVTQSEAPSRVRGTFVGADSQTVVVQSGVARYDVPLEAIRKLEVSRGERSVEAGAWRGAQRGFLAGLVTGVLAGALVMSTIEGDGYVGEEVAGIGITVAGTGLGTLIGTLLGAASPGERWERVPLPQR